jgi:hypothetical protein
VAELADVEPGEPPADADEITQLRYAAAELAERVESLDWQPSGGVERIYKAGLDIVTDASISGRALLFGQLWEAVVSVYCEERGRG